MFVRENSRESPFIRLPSGRTGRISAISSTSSARFSGCMAISNGLSCIVVLEGERVFLGRSNGDVNELRC